MQPLNLPPTNDVYRLGIDIGSTTAKAVFLAPDGRTVFTAYRRHNAETLLTLQTILNEAGAALGNVPAALLVTGSAGMGVAETYALPFIQEVVASAEVIHQRYPQVQTLIDIGGEDAKIIFFDEQQRPDIRMNGSCAGGTGAFIDEMATLLGVPISALDGLARRSTTIYPMASRCGVFAKTDLQNLISRQAPKEDIAASVFHAVVLQTLATLARGRQVRPALLFSGGDFDRALGAAVTSGMDAGSNGGSAGTVMGLIAARSGIANGWVEPLDDTVYTSIAQFPEMRISALARRTARIAEQTLAEAGHVRNHSR